MAWKDNKSEGGRKNDRSKDKNSDNRFSKKTSSKTDKHSKKFENKFPKKDNSAGDQKFTPRPEGSTGEKSGTYSPGFKPLYKGKPSSKIKLTPKSEEKKDDGTIRLNRYIAQAGICSRREADTLIISGAISVNGKVITELGTKILPTDKVKYEEQTLKNEKLVYIVLNKPKDFITTAKDPENRKTVLELVKSCKERVFPVGRLDRNTTGVILLTNDGDLSTKLMHPKHLVKKIYQATIDKPIKHEDFVKISEGLTLEDGFIKPDELAYSSQDNKKELGIEIHSGKNRIVRRIFEAVGYKVLRLDRVYFAGLTKKNLSRGQWRYLEADEVRYLKMLG